MKKLLIASLSGLFFLCSFFTNAEGENTELKAVNDEVQKRVSILRNEYNIIVTQADENNIKNTIIVEKLKNDNTGIDARDKADAAITTYEIVDPVEQQNIYIQYLGGGGGGASPPE